MADAAPLRRAARVWISSFVHQKARAATLERALASALVAIRNMDAAAWDRDAAGVVVSLAWGIDDSVGGAEELVARAREAAPDTRVDLRVRHAPWAEADAESGSTEAGCTGAGPRVTQAAHWDWLVREYADERDDLVVVLLDDDDLLAPDYFALIAEAVAGVSASRDLFVHGASTHLFPLDYRDVTGGFLGPMNWREIKRYGIDAFKPNRFDTSGSAISLSLLRRFFALLRDRLGSPLELKRSYKDVMLRHGVLDCNLTAWCDRVTGGAWREPSRITVAYGSWNPSVDGCSAWRTFDPDKRPITLEDLLCER